MVPTGLYFMMHFRNLQAALTVVQIQQIFSIHDISSCRRKEDEAICGHKVAALFMSVVIGVSKSAEISAWHAHVMNILLTIFTWGNSD